MKTSQLSSLCCTSKLILRKNVKGASSLRARVDNAGIPWRMHRCVSTSKRKQKSLLKGLLNEKTATSERWGWPPVGSVLESALNHA